MKSLELRTIETPDGALPCHIGGTGPLIVLSHPFGGLAWGSLEQLASHCTVVVPEWEQAGFGFTSRTTFAWLDAVLAASGKPHLALGAWSMAGPAAIMYATASPSALSRLILVDVADLSDDFFRLRFWQLPHILLSNLLRRPTRGLVRSMWKDWVHNRSLDSRPLQDAMYRFMRANPYDAIEDEEDDEDGDADEGLIENLGAIDLPTLILTGRHSPVLGPQLAADTVARMPDARLVVFENSSHVLQLEEPERFQQVIAGFVNGA